MGFGLILRIGLIGAWIGYLVPIIPIIRSTALSCKNHANSETAGEEQECISAGPLARNPNNTYPLIQQKVISIDFGDFPYGCASHCYDNITEFQLKNGSRSFDENMVLSFLKIELSVSSDVPNLNNWTEYVRVQWGDHS